ncbi:MAG: Uncharacterised protein [Crocinitomicaceae bacterium]|nr:MAG: Uncharacterised protein [Crocinitomicaceae bacterium]
MVYRPGFISLNSKNPSKSVATPEFNCSTNTFAKGISSLLVASFTYPFKTPLCEYEILNVIIKDRVKISDRMSFEILKIINC